MSEPDSPGPNRTVLLRFGTVFIFSMYLLGLYRNQIGESYQPYFYMIILAGLVSLIIHHLQGWYQTPEGMTSTPSDDGRSSDDGRNLIISVLYFLASSGIYLRGCFPLQLWTWIYIAGGLILITFAAIYFIAQFVRIHPWGTFGSEVLVMNMMLILGCYPVHFLTSAPFSTIQTLLVFGITTNLLAVVLFLLTPSNHLVSQGTVLLLSGVIPVLAHGILSGALASDQTVVGHGNIQEHHFSPGIWNQNGTTVLPFYNSGNQPIPVLQLEDARVSNLPGEFKETLVLWLDDHFVVYVEQTDQRQVLRLYHRESREQTVLDSGSQIVCSGRRSLLEHSRIVWLKRREETWKLGLYNLHSGRQQFHSIDWPEADGSEGSYTIGWKNSSTVGNVACSHA